MKARGFTYLLLLLFLSSCYDVKKPEKPEHLLTESEMVTVLVDMAIVSSAKGINKKLLEDNGIVPDEYIYEKNNIDSITFVKNNEYYAFNIKKYSEIYAKVKDSLTKLRDKYKAIEDKEVKEKEKKDSIKREKKKAKGGALTKKNGAKSFKKSIEPKKKQDSRVKAVPPKEKN